MIELEGSSPQKVRMNLILSQFNPVHILTTMYMRYIQLSLRNMHHCMSIYNSNKFCKAIIQQSILYYCWFLL